MGLLVGLPLKLFYLLFALLRLALPVIVLLVVFWLVRRVYRRSAGQAREHKENQTEPKFHGPVYTVDYQEVDETEDKK